MKNAGGRLGGPVPGFALSVAIALLLVGLLSGCAGLWRSTAGSVKKIPDVTKKAAQSALDGASTIAVSTLASAFPQPDFDYPEPCQPTPLPDEVRYDEACFLCSHNSFSAAENGWFPYRQQFYGEAKQLDLGVRAFMFDTWEVGGRIVLSHGKPCFQKWIRPGPTCRGDDLPGLISRLDFIRFWLQNHPDEIITFILENHAFNTALFDEAIRQTGLQRIVLTAGALEEYRKRANTDRWPNLGWMRRKNFRLVILSDWSDGKWLLPEWEHAIENRPGTLRPGQATRERSESARNRHRTRFLLILNYFPTCPLRLQEFEGSTAKNVVAKMLVFLEHQVENFNYYNDRGAADLIQRVRRCGLQGRYRGMTPTFLVLDNVHEGSPIRHVEALNREARCRASGRKPPRFESP